MSGTGIRLFDLAEARLAWADRRQGYLARNVANVTTPGFRPFDVEPFSRETMKIAAGTLQRTQSRHISGVLQEPAGATSRDDRAGVRSLDGNAVSLDKQLVKVAETDSVHALTTAIYRRYLGMFNIAMGNRRS